MKNGAIFGRQIGRIEGVLNADRDPVQTPDRVASGTLGVAGTRLRERMLGIQKCPRVDARIDLTDPVEAGLRPFLCGERAFSNQARSVVRGQSLDE
jgi:hypothetical protein